MSVVVRKSLGRQLKRARLAARKTPADVQVSGEASTSKLHRIETGAVPIRVETVVSLCVLYGIDSATRERFVEMSKHTNEKGWWEAYNDVLPSWFATYVELETAACRAFMYHSELVTGLLQTPAYRHAQFSTHPNFTEQYAERQGLMRSERTQAAFGRTPPSN